MEQLPDRRTLQYKTFGGLAKQDKEESPTCKSKHLYRLEEQDKEVQLYLVVPDSYRHLDVHVGLVGPAVTDIWMCMLDLLGQPV